MLFFVEKFIVLAGSVGHSRKTHYFHPAISLRPYYVQQSMDDLSHDW